MFEGGLETSSKSKKGNESFVALASTVYEVSRTPDTAEKGAEKTPTLRVRILLQNDLFYRVIFHASGLDGMVPCCAK